MVDEPSKRTQCRACEYGNEGGVDKPKQMLAIYANAGPAGKFFLCKPHAIAFANQIIAEAENIE
jgi:hypothetical protein